MRKYLLSLSLLTSVALFSCSKDKTQGTNPTDSTDHEVEIVSDVAYGQNTNYEGKTEKLQLDIYSPKNSSANQTYPLIVMAHGGSFLTGNKNNLSELCGALAEKGYIAVSIDYRLGWDYGDAQSPSACKGDTISLQKAVYRSLQDYNAALRFLVHNAAKYNINPNWIFIGGSSAGAVAAVNTIYVTPAFANVYFKEEKEELGGLKNADNDLTDDFTIRGDVNMWGAVITPELITSSTAVPMIAFHGSEDETIPINADHYALCSNYPVLYGSQAMYNILDNLGVAAVINIAEGEGHDPDMYKNADFLSTNISCFLNSLISKTPETGSFSNLNGNCQ